VSFLEHAYKALDPWGTCGEFELRFALQSALRREWRRNQNAFLYPPKAETPPLVRAARLNPVNSCEH
jgi:hypothetical protein